MWTNKYDPIFLCQPAGIPRAGAPSRIIRSASDLVLFYNGGDYRVIPTDGRKFDPVKSQDVFFWGYSVGHWEGDTLVIQSIAFNDLTWFEKGGYFHSDKMTATERFTREGDTLRYEVTVNDPEVGSARGADAVPRLRPRQHGHADTALSKASGIRE